MKKWCKIHLYENGVSTVKATDVEKGGFIRRQLVVVGSKKTVEIRPLEEFGKKLLYTTRTDYATDGWDDGGGVACFRSV